MKIGSFVIDRNNIHLDIGLLGKPIHFGGSDTLGATGLLQTIDTIKNLHKPTTVIIRNEERVIIRNEKIGDRN